MSDRIWSALERVGLAKRVVGAGDLPERGRSSEPSYGGYNNLFGGGPFGYITPAVPFEITTIMENAAIYNPNISQAVKNWTNLANTGHELVIDAPDRVAEKAIEILNAAAYRIYTRSAGVDGLINHLLDQVAVSGAVCAEDVVDLGRFEISEVALVPPGTIRFREEDGKLAAYQQSKQLTQPVKLNEHTFAMYCLQVYRDSPYPKPPMTAALGPMLDEKRAMENIAFIIQKLGLLGVIDVQLTAPNRKPNETDDQFQKRLSAHLSEAMEKLAPNFRNGFMVGYEDHKLNFFSATGNAAGARDLFQTVEEHMYSGMGTTPAMHGRNYTTTETFAGVIYNILLQDSRNSQRLVKRRIERSYRLELMLHGIEVDGVSLRFNPSKSLNPYPEALAESTKVRTAILKAEKGMADPDEIAQEMGYDAWYDAEKLLPQVGGITLSRRRHNPLAVRFDRAANRYRASRPRIEVRSARLAKDEDAARLLDEALARYGRTLGPYLNEARGKGLERAVAAIREATDQTWPEAEAFASSILAELRQSYVQVLSSGTFAGAVRDHVEEEYINFKVDPATAWSVDPPIAFEIGGFDKRAIEFMGRVDNFFFSKFVDNQTMAGPIKSFLQEHYLENGEAMFNKTTPEAIDKFRDLFEDRLKGLENHQVGNIINHSVQRMRNWSAGEQMLDAGIEYAQVVAILDNRTSEICRYMHGKRIPIGTAMEGLSKVVELSPEQYEQHLKAIKPDDYYRETSVDQVAADGRGLPPYHAGGCRTRTRVVIS